MKYIDGSSFYIQEKLIAKVMEEKHIHVDSIVQLFKPCLLSMGRICSPIKACISRLPSIDCRLRNVTEFSPPDGK
tara:strand:- start:850 stop:1074 length:225 start_codon:yes stop_codon:yes gene_type:complete